MKETTEDNTKETTKEIKSEQTAEDSHSQAEPKVEVKKPSIPTPEQLQKEFQSVIQDKFGGMVQVFSMDQNQAQAQAAQQPVTDEEPPIDFTFSYTPKQVTEWLDKKIIGQQEAKKALSIAVCDHYRHLQAEQEGDVAEHYQKQNVLFLGPTGVGKTFLIRSIAELIGVPFVKADATRFSETGYMGANVDDIVRELVQQADGDQRLAESGIVYVDEIDKIAGVKDRGGKDVSGRGVQFGFLRLLEDAEVDLNASHDIASQFKTLMNFQKKGKADKELIRTKNILFIFSGAFQGLTEIIKKRAMNHSIGIGADVQTASETEGLNLLSKVMPEDLVEFGFEREFVGRVPVITSCHNLSQADLYEVLTGSEASVLKQYIRSFEHYGISLKFTDESLLMIAEKAFHQKTGARALVQVLESLLRDFKYELPSKQITELRVTKEMIDNPHGYLQYVLSQQLQ